MIFLLAPVATHAQADRPLIDVESYNIDVEIDFETQVLEAQTEVRFIPREETHLIVFELNNGLNLSRVEAADGSEVPAVRYRQDFTIRLNFYDTLPIGDPVSLTFFYDGRLEGTENSPVEGVSLASIEPDRAFLLYPGRWFPVNGYGADRFAANISVTTVGGYHVIASGLPTHEFAEDGKEKRKFTFDRASFPGSIAVLPDDPLRVDGRLGSTDVYFHSVDEDLSLALRRCRRLFHRVPHRQVRRTLHDVARARGSGRVGSNRLFRPRNHLSQPFWDRSRSEPSVGGYSGSPPMVESHGVPGEPQPRVA